MRKTISTLACMAALGACAGGTMKAYYAKSDVAPVAVEKAGDDALVMTYRVLPETRFYSSGVNYATDGDSLKVPVDRHPAARELRARFPETVSDARVAHAAVRAIDAGIDDPAKIAGAVERNGDLHVAGDTPGFRATVGAREQAGDTEALNKQLAERSLQPADSVQHESPALRMA